MSEGRAPADRRARVVEASAPCHVHLGGGSLETGPPALFDPGLVTVTVAIDRRVSCRVETPIEGVEIESKDSSEKQRGGSVAELLATGRGGLAASVLQGLGVETGVRVVTQARAAEAWVLGSASALATALTGAVAKAIGRELPDEELAALSREAEVRARKVPAGIGGHYAALRGGVLALETGPAGVSVERLLVDPARVEESLVLLDAKESGVSGSGEWRARKGEIDRDDRQHLAAALAETTRQVREALLAGRHEDLVVLLRQEWEARRRLGWGLTTPAFERVVEVLSEAGAAVQVSGRMIVIWAPPGARGPGCREAVRVALDRHGWRVIPARVDLRGLDLEEVA